MTENYKVDSSSSAKMNSNSTHELELQTHLAEYDSLRRENDRIVNERQQLVLATLGATVVLSGILVENSWFLSYFSARFYIVLPLAFNLVTWWYLRTNYATLVLNQYILKQLQPRLQEIAGEYAFRWTDFAWHSELSRGGRIFVLVMTVSKFGLVQGGAIASVIMFVGQTSWRAWALPDYLLLGANLVSFGISVMLLRATQKQLTQIRGVIDHDRSDIVRVAK